METVALYDTLDLLSGFVKGDEAYWKGRAGVITRSTQSTVLKAAYKTLEPAALEAAVVESLKAESGNNTTEALAHLNNLDESARYGLLVEFIRQRFMREAQVGLGEADAHEALETLRNSGVSVDPAAVIAQYKEGQ